MGNKLFDHLLKHIQGAFVYTGTTQVSLEIDFDIPRGFVVKIHSVELRVDRMHEDVEAEDVDKLLRYRIVLLKDPDDTTTQSFGSNNIQHDVLMDLEVSLMINDEATIGQTILQEPNSKYREFSRDGKDVIVARNMRLNGDVEGTSAAEATEAFGIALIDYTLEEIKDEEMLNVLDIL